MTQLLVLCLAAATFWGAAAPAAAWEKVIRTDANLVTALDVSDSIGRHEEWIQHIGIIRGILDRGFLHAVRSGYYGRIGFAIFTWSSGGRYELVVPWTVIASIEDAERVSALLESITLIDRSHYAAGDGSEDNAPTPDRLTDISAAIEHATMLLDSAPYTTARPVINICANGSDNAEGGPESSREHALASGITINGLVLGRNVEVVDHFRSSVIGGPGAFVMELIDPQGAGEIMAEKLRRDLIARAEGAGDRSD